MPRLILLHRRVHNQIRPPPLLRPLHLHRRLGMLRQKPRQWIHINPDLIIPLLLGLVKYKLKPPVKVYRLDIIDILMISGLRGATGIPDPIWGMT